MDFGIAVETDVEGDRRSELVQRVSDSLSDYLRDKDFGVGVQHVFVGFICERVVPGFESFARPERDPRYQPRQSVELIGGGSEELRNTYSYDVKLDPAQYERFVAGPEGEALALLVDVLVESLCKLDELPTEVGDFDVEGFKSTVTRHLRQLAGSK